jgi:C-terminal processing protease CtpA/Prc
VLEKKGDWVCLASVDSKKDAAAAGLKKNDRLVAIDSQSLRYLSESVVASKLLAPRLTNGMLEFERDVTIRVPAAEGPNLKALGFKLKLEYEGLFIHGVRKDSPAEHAGLRDKDFVVRVGDVATRYTPIKKVVDLIQNTREEGVLMAIRRTTLITRK